MIPRDALDRAFTLGEIGLILKFASKRMTHDYEDDVMDSDRVLPDLREARKRLNEVIGELEEM